MSSRLKFATLGVAVVALAYGATSWYAGRFTQQSIESWVAQANQEIQLRWHQEGPRPQLVLADYQRGVFKSQVRYVFEFQDSDGATQRLTVQDDLQHGPWPLAAIQAGIWQPLAAYSHLQPVSDGTWKSWFDITPDAQAPWSATTQVGFGGQIDSLVTVLPVRLNNDGQLDFSGGTIAIHHAPDTRQTQVSGQAKSLAITDEDGASKLQLQEIRFQGQSTSGSQADFQSSQEIHLASLQLEGPDMPPVRLDQPSAQIDMARTGSLLDARVHYDLGKLFIDQQDVGTIQLNVSSQQLDVDALQAFMQAVDQLPDDPDYEDLSAADQQLLKTRLLSVLATSPVLALDSLTWSTPKGKTDLHARIQFRPVVEPVPEDSGALIERGIQQIKLSAGVSKPMLMSVLAQAQSSSEGAFGAALFSMIFDQYVGQLLQADLVREQDGQVRTDITYADGQVSVNGQAAVTPDEFMQQLDAVLGMGD
ncbi:YdgA family protein [Castellaniella sp.]|uniref:YdgA family protein n=1 Tax=Castellaniella sp. TaxID=1955812 RepID=UPI002AFFF1F1|nr:YdgA family protein [Castellaniella sp.]